MNLKLSIFDEAWLSQTRARKLNDSWVDDVIANVGTTGGMYLATLRLWFEKFPLFDNARRELKKRIESCNNEAHLGAVNELAWWAFMQHCGLDTTPISVTSSPRPDFQVNAPQAYFVEVTTLNVSNHDKDQFMCKTSANLDHLETMRRIIFKFTDEKINQISYAASKKCPCLLVLFDYTTWSAFGTQFFCYLADYLFGQRFGFNELPADLSALVYVERKVINGKIGISQDRSAIFYNPHAKCQLSTGIFSELRQFYDQRPEEEPKSLEQWIWL